MAKILQGEEIILSLYDTTAEEYLPIGCLTENGITQTQEITEGEPNKCATTPPKSLGAYTYDINADGQIVDSTDPDYATWMHIEAIDALFRQMRIDKEPIFWKQESPNGDQFGEGYITELSTSAPTNAVATFSLALTGVGEISETDLAPA